MLTIDDELGPLLEAFVNAVSHPRGRVLTFMSKASVTVDQAILLSFASKSPNSTPSSLASIMNITLPSASQMIERLARLGLVRRIEDIEDRRRKTIEVTAKARTFLARLREVRCSEFTASTASLSSSTRRRLRDALSRALDELSALKSSSPRTENSPGTEH